MGGVNEGDLIFFSGHGLVSNIIKLATFSGPSGFSHVGVVSSLHGRLLMYESTSFERPPCVRTGKPVKGVQAHWLSHVAEWGGSTLYHVPLRRKLYQHEVQRLRYYLDTLVSRPYDFIGAGRSAGFLFRRLQSVFRPEDLSSLYCSELAGAALEEVGIFQCRNCSFYSPNALYRILRREGVVGRARRVVG